MTAASANGHALWGFLRARQEPASVPTLSAAIGAGPEKISWRLSRWARAGLIDAIKADGERTHYLMRKDARSFTAPPALTGDCTITRKRDGRTAMWRAILGLRRFDLVQLTWVAGVSEDSAKVYVSALLRAGILRRERRGSATTGIRSIYALNGKFGPRPPVVNQRREKGRSITTVTDPNTGDAREISACSPSGPLF